MQGTFSLPADPPGLAGQWKQLDLSFLPGTFASGDLLSFGVDRDESDVTGPGGAAGGNSADLLGGGVLIPSGKFVPGGARFFGKFEGGFPFRGEFFNLHRARLQPARRLRLHQRGSGGESGAEEAEVRTIDG